MTWWRRALARIGVEVHRLEDLQGSVDEQAAAEGRYVFVYDDDVSPMDLVIRWLERSFELPRKEAALVMVTVHRLGWYALGPFDKDEVAAKLARARQVASELGLDRLEFTTARRHDPTRP